MINIIIIYRKVQVRIINDNYNNTKNNYKNNNEDNNKKV